MNRVRGGSRVQWRATIWFLAAMFMVVPTATIAFNDPGGFRGLEWGTPQVRAEERLALQRCWPATGRRGPQTECVGPVKIGPLDVRAVYIFRRGQLVMVTIDFAGADRSLVEGIFVERYGQPTHRVEGDLVWYGAQTVIWLLGIMQGKETAANLTWRAEYDGGRHDRESIREGAKDL